MIYKEILNFLDDDKYEKLLQEHEKIHEVMEEIKDYLLGVSLNSREIFAVGGGFSAGKSTFINSFIKSNFKLDSDILPCTKTPIYVIPSDNEQIFAKISDGLIKIHDIKRYENLAEYFLVNTKLIKNIAFLDTPGYNNQSDYMIALNILSQGNKILWLIGSDSNGTISSEDLKLLAKIKKEVFVVLNKADLLSSDDRKNVMNEIYSQCINYGINIRGLSAYCSLEGSELDFKIMPLIAFLLSNFNNNYENELKKKSKEVFDKYLQIKEHQKYQFRIW